VDIKNLIELLRSRAIVFEIIEQDKPIITLTDAARYFPIEKAVPTLVAQTDRGLVALFVSSSYGKVDFSLLKDQFKFQKMKMADRKQIVVQTGYEVGAIPLVGLTIPCIMDKKLFQYDFVYGGTGNPMFTLKIAPNSIASLNNVIGLI